MRVEVLIKAVKKVSPEEQEMFTSLTPEALEEHRKEAVEHLGKVIHREFEGVDSLDVKIDLKHETFTVWATFTDNDGRKYGAIPVATGLTKEDADAMAAADVPEGVERYVESDDDEWEVDDL